MKAFLAKYLDRLGWVIEDLAINLDEKAASLEWEIQWEKRGNPTCIYDELAGHYRVRN